MKLALILLAAGEGRRFQGNKLLSDFRGKPMYRYLVDEVEKLPPGVFDRKLVVTQYKAIGEDLSAAGYQVVENHESELGISHSIHLALTALGSEPGRSDEEDMAYCFAVCDQPYLKADTIRELTTGFKASGKGIGCLCNMGEFGNPAIFSNSYQEELLSLRGDVGGKRVIRRHIDDLYLCEVEDGMELVDIDYKT